MTSASLSTRRLERPPVERRLEDRWIAPSARLGRFSIGMTIVIVGSLALHVVVVATAVFDESRVAPPPQEIAVEIIQEKPADTPKPAGKPAPQASNREAKAEATKPQSPEPINKVATEAPKPAPKVDAKPPEPPVLKPALAEDKPEPPAPDTKARDAKQAQDKVAALEKEFESLKAERNALETQHADEAAAEAKARAAAVPRPRADAGLGPLPESFQAIALPATTSGADDELVGYQEVVFSQLAKANELGQSQGLPGSTGVHFTIDEAGALVSVEIVNPSGIAALDEQALAIVHKAAPFPPPPQGAQRSFDANVNFVADGSR